MNSLRFGPVLIARNCNNPARRELSRLESSLVHEKGAWQFALTGHVASCFIANAFAIDVTKEDILRVLHKVSIVCLNNAHHILQIQFRLKDGWRATKTSHQFL